MSDIYDIIESGRESRDAEEQDRLYDKYKKIFIMADTIFFSIFIISGVITLIKFIFITKYAFFEFFNTPYFIIMIISGLGFIITPYYIKFMALKGEELKDQLRINKFKSNFIKTFNKVKEFDLTEISREYKIKEDTLRKIFEELLTKGTIKGELVGNTFKVAEGFKIQPLEEQNKERFINQVAEYVKPYRWINIGKLARYFKVPVEFALEEVRKQLNEHKITGFLDGENLVRELSMIAVDFTDLPECPYCNNKVLPHSRYCSTCGKKIDFDVINFEEEEKENKEEDEDPS
ncbi:MAG: hypothetical protein ACTSU2_02985 [Promethearchaeota archaeon]